MGEARSEISPTDAGSSWQALVGDLVRAERPLPTVIDVRHRLATKDRGLRAAARALGVPMSATLAAGDGPSDVSMLQAAGRGVAVGRRTAAPAAAADVVVTRAGLVRYLGLLAEECRLPLRSPERL